MSNTDIFNRYVSSSLDASESMSASVSILMNALDVGERERASIKLRESYVAIHCPLDPLAFKGLGLSDSEAERRWTLQRIKALNAAAKTLAERECQTTLAQLPSTHARYDFCVARTSSNGAEHQIHSTHRLDAKSFVTVGRSSQSLVGVPFPHDLSTSRTHAMLLLTPERVLVIDVGSIAGIQTLSRSSSDRPLVHSMPLDRRVLTFGRNETFELLLGTGGVRLRVSPASAKRALVIEPVDVDAKASESEKKSRSST